MSILHSFHIVGRQVQPEVKPQAAENLSAGSRLLIHRSARKSSSLGWVVGATALVIGLTSPAAATQTYGSLGNFDAVNDTGSTAHGFEIDLEGISKSDVTDVFGGVGRSFPPSVERYGGPTITSTTFADGASGVAIVYQGAFDSATQSWNVGTPSGVYSTPGESCWTGGGIGYGPSTPCDHFGVGTSKTPTLTSYHWLTQTTPTSPVLNTVAAQLPAAVQVVTPPAPPAPGQPPAQPKVQGEVQAPAPDAGNQFGVAEWVKVYTTQYDHPVALEDLVAGGKGLAPNNPSETEIEWQLLQTELGVPGSGLLESLDQQAGAGKESVLRRYEFYSYTGGYSAEGQALTDAAMTGPGGNVGAFIGAQNLAVNLNGVFAAPSPAAGSGLLSLGFLVVTRLRKRGALIGDGRL
ncbi:hypothetical protein MCBRY_003488 [Methylocystis bryophila]